MSKLMKFVAIAGLIAGSLAITQVPAAAQHGGHGGHGWHGGGWHGGGWHGGGWHRGWRGRGWGFGPGWGWGYPYYGAYYYGGPDCGWYPLRVVRNHRWVVRRAWRCW